jgi:membrane protein
MSRPTITWRKVTAQPGHFAFQVLKAFQKNQGLLLSGALAYYILLSVIPLFTFLLLMLSHMVDEAALLATLRRYIVLIIPGDSEAVLNQVRNILEHREVASWVVLCAMLFFSSLAFSVLENAMSIIFVHRVRHKPRPLIVSLILPYVYILLLGVGFLVMTAVASLLQSMSNDKLMLLGRGWSLGRLSVVLLYLIGVAGLILVLTSIWSCPQKDAYVHAMLSLAGSPSDCCGRRPGTSCFGTFPPCQWSASSTVRWRPQLSGC